MELGFGTGEKLLRKRKFYISAIVVLTVLLLLAFNLESWIFLNRMGKYLEGELATRLASMAHLSSRMIEREGIQDLFPSEETLLSRFLVRDILVSIVRENQLERAFIIDEGYRVLISSREELPFGEKLTYILEDSSAVERAWTGMVAVSKLHFVEGNRFKSAYVPIRNVLGTPVGILVLEANAAFFNILRNFRQGLIVGGIASLGLIILFSFFLYWAISLLIRTQESLRRSERLAAMGQMAATVAHEIRNPLGVIKGASDVLRDRYDDRDNSDELFDYIPGEVRRLNRLINDFLSFAKEPNLTMKPGDLKKTVMKSLAALETEFQQARVEVDLDIPAELPSFTYDEDAINQVLFNLLLNALQSMDTGGRVKIGVVIETHRGKKYAAVKIEDTGAGIQEDAEKIFEPFFTTKSSGSGLGLAITKRLLEKHGGWILAESKKGKGTKMRFYLPLKSTK